MTHPLAISRCPFCGSIGPQLEELDISSWAVVCQTCHAIGPMDAGQTIVKAIDLWNDRTGVTP